MWIARQNGLMRYDGYQFRRFVSRLDDPGSLAHDNLGALLQDRRGLLWLGTWGGGLQRIDARMGWR